MYSRKSGFTLLEVLISTVIFVTCAVAVIWAFNAGLFASSAQEDIGLALNIAQAKMEEVKDTAFASLAASGPLPDPNFTRFSVSVTVSDIVEDLLKRIDVTVAWNVKGGQTSVNVTTLAANH